jgi:hypothetical protein
VESREGAFLRVELREGRRLVRRRDKLESEAQKRSQILRGSETAGQVMEGKVSGAIEILKKRHRGEQETGIVIDREVRVGDGVKR